MARASAVCWRLFVVVLAGSCLSHSRSLGSENFANGDDDLKNENQLEHGDCYYADAQNGLSCDREGYYINGFEGTAWWDPGQLPSWEWEKVPSSRALCCRPSVPDKWPRSNGTEEATPVGIISVGCHTSTNTGARNMQCESDSNSFVTGFQNSLSLPKSTSTFYPVDSIECCTPAMLMSTGDAWSIERCGCTTQTDDISCDSSYYGEFLWGFENVGETGKSRHAIPLQPAMCCKLCIGKKVLALDKCKDLDMCNRNGVCVMGTCQCLPGYSGSTCANESPSTGSKQPWYQSIWLMGILGCVFLIGALGLIFLMSHRREYGDVNWLVCGLGNDRNESTEATNLLLTHEGSAGSVDTRCSSTVVSLMREDDMADLADQDDSIRENCYRDISTSEPRTDAIDLAGVDLQSAARRTKFDGEPGGSQDQSSPYGYASSLQDNLDYQSEDVGFLREEPTDENNERNKDDERLPANPATTSRTVLTCTICFERPVQVALVPCGHSSLCRKCSRKLQQCPFCRKDIVRRQKLFLSN